MEFGAYIPNSVIPNIDNVCRLYGITKGQEMNFPIPFCYGLSELDMQRYYFLIRYDKSNGIITQVGTNGQTGDAYNVSNTITIEYTKTIV